MVRSICLLFAGVFMAVEGVFKIGVEPTAAEKTGWAYQNLGSNGVAYCMIGLGTIFAILGGIILIRQIKRIKATKEQNKN